jgi:hypothetical protein
MQFWRACLTGLLVALMLGSCGNPAPVPVVTGGTFIIQVPDSITIGSPLLVEVIAGQAPDGASLTLVWFGSGGTRLYRNTFRNKQAIFNLKETETESAGLVTLVAQAGPVRAEKKIRLLPGTPVDPLIPLVGARSVIADTNHWSMVVTVPLDRFGNPVEDGTPVLMKALRPDGRIEEKQTSVTNLLAWWRIYSGTKSGRTIVSVTSGGAYGSEGLLLEVAGPPVSFQLSASPLNLAADGRQLTTLRTAILRDKFGNVVEEGTLVNFRVILPTGEITAIPAYTIKGIAEAPLQAPLVPGQVQIIAVALGVESEPLNITFEPGPAVGNIPVNVVKEPTGKSIIIQAGPLTGRQAQLVPDGTPVQFIIKGAGNYEKTLTSNTDLGQASVTLRVADMVPGAFTVEVAAGSGKGNAQFKVP